jgi:hypothetical protein
MKKKIPNGLGPLCLSLIKHDMRALNLCAGSTQTAPFPLLLSSLTAGPTRSSSSLLLRTPLLARFWQKQRLHEWKNGILNENLQIIRRWKALGEENMLVQFIFSMVYCASLAWKIKSARSKYGESNPALGGFNWLVTEPLWTHTTPTGVPDQLLKASCIVLHQLTFCIRNELLKIAIETC